MVQEGGKQILGRKAYKIAFYKSRWEEKCGERMEEWVGGRGLAAD